MKLKTSKTQEQKFIDIISSLLLEQIKNVDARLQNYLVGSNISIKSVNFSSKREYSGKNIYALLLECMFRKLPYNQWLTFK